jgi:NADPH2:quinone reductase
MRAVQITELSGPQSALQLVELPEPDPRQPLIPGDGVLIDVHAAGVSFPEVLQTRGEYQLKPELPFVPGSEVGGVVRVAPPGSPLQPGDRVAALTLSGGFAEVAVAASHFVFPIPDQWSFAQAAGLILNYHTAYFALLTRGRLRAGETVLVHGAAGGVGTAALQVAKGLGARTVALVSTDAKAEVVRAVGADVVLRSDGPWKDEAKDLGGVDIVLDPVGGERFTDSLRTLREGGRLVVVGFTAGSIPEVKVNRLLLNNLDVVGAGWGAYALRNPDYAQEVGRALAELVASGHVAPVVGATFPLEQAAAALQLIDSRGATGKVTLSIR